MNEKRDLMLIDIKSTEDLKIMNEADHDGFWAGQKLREFYRNAHEALRELNPDDVGKYEHPPIEARVYGSGNIFFLYEEGAPPVVILESDSKLLFELCEEHRTSRTRLASNIQKIESQIKKTFGQYTKTEVSKDHFSYRISDASDLSHFLRNNPFTLEVKVFITHYAATITKVKNFDNQRWECSTEFDFTVREIEELGEIVLRRIGPRP
jgi:hypothetical protein